jgi:hypothetical protein
VDTIGPEEHVDFMHKVALDDKSVIFFLKGTYSNTPITAQK